jgi:RNA 3'-terminal phosphate cyclase (ATP)
MLEIDGSSGEGGGQILRTSLALSLVTGTPFQIDNIRANRKKPGLRHQHLAAVNAAAQVGLAEVTGHSLGSTRLTFAPQTVQPGHYHFAVGTAGSSTLVFQTVLPALMLAKASSYLTVQGGTHNPMAPTFDFLQDVFLPLIRRMGPNVESTLERPGFYPAGGGKFSATITPVERLSPIVLDTRGPVTRRIARALVARLPAHIGNRELQTVRDLGRWKPQELYLHEVPHAIGPGNVLTLIIESQHVTEVFTGFGKRGVPAEKVARRALADMQEYLDADVPVGRYLADQLLLPMALAGGGRFRTLEPTQHTVTNLAVLRKFLSITAICRQCDQHTWEILVSPKIESS